MKSINLTNCDKVVLVDDEVYDKLQLHNWWSNRGYAQTTIAGKATLMHRLLLLEDNHTKLEVDHINRNPLDNRLCNLRLSSKSQNKCNSVKKLGTSSIFKGVVRNKANKKWQAQIVHDGNKVYLGCFDSELDAALVYNSAAVRLHGQFARINENI